MSRYAHLDDLKDVLKGISLDAWSVGALGNDTTERDRLLEGFLEQADTWVDGATQRVFTPLMQRMDILSGTGGTALSLPGSPVVDVQSVQIITGPYSPAIAVPPQSLRLDRAIGRLTILPGLQVMAPMVGSAFPSWTFPKGISNVLVQYRTGYAIVGGNVSSTALLADPWPQIAAVTTDASYAYFTLPSDFGLYKSGVTIASRGAGAMLRDGSDDSVNWSMVSPRQLRCPIASYSSAANYVFVHLPAAISQAVVAKATADVLRDKGAKDGAGGGGATRIQAGPFSQDFGEMAYAGQIKALDADAARLVSPYRRALVVIA